MSIKIYDAYRLPAGGDAALHELLFGIRDQARTNARRLLREHYIKLMREMPEPDRWQSRLGAARERVLEGFKKSVVSPFRSEYSLEISLGIFSHERRYYLRAFWDRSSVVGDALDFLKTHEALSEFHYQNSTDRPRSISAGDWENRERVWREIYKENHGRGNYLVLDVLTWDGFYLDDPWLELFKEFTLSPPVLPSREEVWVEKLGELSRLRGLVSTPGMISGASTTSGRVLIERRGEKWVSVIGHDTLEHDTLDRAADHVYFEHLPEDTKEMVRRIWARGGGRDARAGG